MHGLAGRPVHADSSPIAFLARAYGAARPSLDWENAVDYGERVVDGERFLFSLLSVLW